MLCSDSWRSIYDGQADRAICEFYYLATRSRYQPSQSVQPITPHAPSTIVAPFACHVRSRGAFPFYALLRGIAYPTVRSRMPSELATVMTTTLSLIPDMKFCFRRSPFTFDMPASYFFLRDCKAATPPCAQHPLAFGTTNQRRVIHFAAGSRATSSEIARQLQIKSRAASSFVVASRAAAQDSNKHW